MLAVTLLFAFLRYRFARWPFHPVLFLMLGTWPSTIFGFSFLLGWAIKAAVARFGGAGLYQRLKPLMIGLVAGDMFAAMVTLIVGLIYYLNTGDPPKRYMVMPT
jgi:hypothetical protein